MFHRIEVALFLQADAVCTTALGIFGSKKASDLSPPTMSCDYQLVSWYMMRI
jgi:hypothetical protein